MTPETQAAILAAHRKEGPPDAWNWEGCTAPFIRSVVARLAGLTQTEIMGRQRTRCISRARQITYAIIREIHPKMTLAEIGRVMDKDATSIWHALDILPAAIRCEPETKRLYAEAKRRLVAP